MKQRGRFAADRHYRLELSYADPHELAMDILRHVPEVEEMEPEELREAVREKMRGMKHRIDRGVYVTFGSINPQLAVKTEFSDADAEVLKSISLG